MTCRAAAVICPQLHVKLLVGQQFADGALTARMSCISAVISAMPLFACAVPSASCGGGASDGTYPPQG